MQQREPRNYTDAQLSA